MAARKQTAAGRSKPVERSAPIKRVTPVERATVDAVLARLERLGTPRTRDGLSRYGITAPRAFGVSMADVKSLGKELGRDPSLARALWGSGWYEARLLVAFVADPATLTVTDMNRWTADFDSRAVCDTLCFHLYDRSPHAWGRVDAWATADAEFVKRAAFALLASLAGHDRRADDAPFLERLPLIAAAAPDPRNFVKKAVSWALRRIGTRSRALHAAATALATELTHEESAAARWVGRDTLKDLERPLVTRRLAR